MRERYRTQGITMDDVAAEPYTQFTRWFADAVAAAEAGAIAEPNAMVLSTADAEGLPGSRTVLLKGYDPRGFVFFSNYESRKGRALDANPRASLLFPWHAIARQVIVGGDVTKVSPEETAAYFHSRPYGSQIGAWSSEQSSVVGSRKVLEERYAELAARWPEGTRVPVPPFWGGFRVEAVSVEFWQGRDNRLHDRLRYVRGAGGWSLERLAP
ncbi:pyridoxamine 5'-phosphate oxidase [Streptomyces sp. NPDC049040]|uniref:pyridoxamine 5'-phosphate oxidase n=1 Tax=Streptomyces sp. NPDC049040 TaxID=3365593 RepID=UPI00372216BB